MGIQKLRTRKHVLVRVTTISQERIIRWRVFRIHLWNVCPHKRGHLSIISGHVYRERKSIALECGLGLLPQTRQSGLAFDLFDFGPNTQNDTPLIRTPPSTGGVDLGGVSLRKKVLGSTPNEENRPVLKLGATIAGFLLASAATAQENTMIVFDASGSMWGQLDGRAKIEIARDAFDQSRDLWAGNPSSDIGLIAFGHRRKGDCSDIEVLVEPTPGAADVVIEKVSGLSPKGKTPLSDSVRLAAERLRYTEDKATVILFSDGVETCKADPCATSAELEELGIDFTAHVIGLGIATDDDKEKLRCLAENTGGLYRDAADTGSLIKAFAEVKSTDLVTVTASDAPETLIDTVVQIILAEGTVRPNSVALRATNVTSGERRNLGNLTGADQIIQGLAVSLPAGEWRIEAISPEGSGAIEVDVRPNLETVDVPFKAALARFSLADGSPYLLGVEHGFFLTPSAALQANAEFTVGLVARGANADGAFVDYEYRFGTDGSGMSYHTFVSPDQAGPYDVIVANGSDVLARFPVTYAQNVVPKWNGATRGSPGGRLDIKITGDTYYYNSLMAKPYPK